MSRIFSTRNLLAALTLSASFFLAASDANAQFSRSSSTSVNRTAGAVGVRAYGPFAGFGRVAAGASTSVDHEVTRTTPYGTVSRGTEVDTARGGVVGGVYGPYAGAGFRGGFRAGSVSHGRVVVR